MRVKGLVFNKAEDGQWKSPILKVWCEIEKKQLRVKSPDFWSAIAVSVFITLKQKSFPGILYL
jgi:hypothetical protein